MRGITLYLFCEIGGKENMYMEDIKEDYKEGRIFKGGGDVDGW